jgi:dipeptidyl aminopeptidase/acylaminoacyl peptidase
LDVEGVLRLPPRYKEGTRLPLLTIVHGGPTGVALENFPIPRLYPTQLFLDQGFAVFEPNFRGSINYGPKFRLPTIQQQGYGDMDDVMTGIDTLIEKGVADPDRLGIMGWSYGGYLSTWIVSHTTRFKAASIGACSMDWVTHYGSAVGTEDGPPEVVQEYFGGKPWDRFEAYDRHSPRYFLKNIKTPSLLLRGEKDSDTIGELYLALTELNVPATFVTYPREPHGVGEPAHQRDLLLRNLQWFKKWLMP